MTLPEILSAINITTGDLQMQEGFKKRGITDPEKLFCAPRTVGNFGEDAETNRRLVKVDCFDITNVKIDVFEKGTLFSSLLLPGVDQSAFCEFPVPTP